MDKSNNKIICLDEEGEDLGDSNSSEMEEEEEEIDKPSISKSNTKQENQQGSIPGSNKNGTNGSSEKAKPQKKQRSTNKVSIDELTKQIKSNQQKRISDNDQGIVIKGTFDWVDYNTAEDKTLNYISDFLKSNEGNNLDYAKLDLIEFEDVNIVQHHSQVSSITDDLYKRILRYGQIENISRIAKKSGAISKGEGTNVNFRDELYYDQEDPFIDDDEYTAAAHKGGYSQRMQLAEVFIDDFRTFDGDLKDFVKCEIYKNRVEIMQNLEKKNQIQDETDNLNKKKKKPAGPSSTNNLQTAQPNSLTAALNSATQTLSSKIQKKSTAEIEKDLNQAESVKTQDKKKVKKEGNTSSTTAQSLQNAQNLLSGGGLSQSLQQQVQAAAVQNQQNQAAQAAANAAAQGVAAANLLLGTDLNQTQLNQLLSQSAQNANNSMLQNAQQALSLDYLKQPQSALSNSSYLMQPFFNSGLMFPNYLDHSQSLLLGQLDFTQNMMLFNPQQQSNPIANNLMYPQTQAYNLTSTSQNSTNPALQKSQHDHKDKKKKKKPVPNATALNKDLLNNKGKSQQMNLIEIEDDDDPSQNTQTQSGKTGMETEK